MRIPTLCLFFSSLSGCWVINNIIIFTEQKLQNISVTSLKALTLYPSLFRLDHLASLCPMLSRWLLLWILSVLIIILNSYNVCVFCKIFFVNKFDLFEATCSIIRSIFFNFSAAQSTILNSYKVCVFWKIFFVNKLDLFGATCSIIIRISV